MKYNHKKSKSKNHVSELISDNLGTNINVII